MSDRSIEQSQEFHLVKRVASVVAPGWTVLSSFGVDPEHVAIDHSRRRIEVGESTEKYESVALALWGVAHARLDYLGMCPEFFGKNINPKSYVGPLVKRLSELGEEADLAALEWAEKTAELLWPHAAAEIRGVLSEMPHDKNTWVKHFIELP